MSDYEFKARDDSIVTFSVTLICLPLMQKQGKIKIGLNRDYGFTKLKNENRLRNVKMYGGKKKTSSVIGC